MARSGPVRVAVLGAGPVGLEAALYARSLNLPVTVFERGRVGEHLHRWGHVKLFTPFGMTSTSLGKAAIRDEKPKHAFPADTDLITGRELVAAYLDPLAQTELLRDFVKTETTVLHVGRAGLLKDDPASDPRRQTAAFRLLVRPAKGEEHIEEADVILDCTGAMSRPRWLGDGVPAAGELAAAGHIAHTLEDIPGERRAHYAGKCTLLIGSGHSAATTACRLSDLADTHPDTWVIWLTRGSKSQPIGRVMGDPLKERDRLAVRANSLATRGDGNLEFHTLCLIDRIEGAPDKGFKVSGRVAGKPRTWEVERIIANVGTLPDWSLAAELHVAERLGDKPAGPKTPEPGYFVLGAKSAGRDAQFLMRTGFEQVREVFAAVMGKAGLDLYAKRAA